MGFLAFCVASLVVYWSFGLKGEAQLVTTACIRHTPNRILGKTSQLANGRLLVKNALECAQRCILRRPPCESAVHHLFTNGIRECILFDKDSRDDDAVQIKPPHIPGQEFNLYEIVDECQINATWASWGPWQECSQTCGKGQKLRIRNCNSGELVLLGQETCQGQRINFGECEIATCADEPSWTTWGPWSDCSVLCGIGSRTRARLCKKGTIFGVVNPAGCSGNLTESVSCSGQQCFSPNNLWSNWSPCSKSCGKGSRTREKPCKDANCVGKILVSEPCNAGSCETSGFSSWSQWGKCSSECGSGLRLRTRKCLLSVCTETTSETKPCSGIDCIGWNAWRSWTPCTVTCGPGFQTRSRFCTGSFCDGKSVETLQCNKGSCPHWENWESWNSCSATCGEGERIRRRSCSTDNSLIPIACVGSPTETDLCNALPCSIWTDWAQWSDCSVSCGAGVSIRTRQCSNKVCEGLRVITQPCNKGRCPTWGVWQPWTECSVTCSSGVRSRFRVCRFGLFCPGRATLTEQCNVGICPSWSLWGGWSACSATCGAGNKTQVRTCRSGEEDVVVGKCTGEPRKVGPCNERVCPEWLPWFPWESCSTTCGTGMRTRIRTCIGEEACDKKLMSNTQVCDAGPCPIWGQWNGWSSCSATCGGGTEKRTRNCRVGQQSIERSVCNGSSFETNACNNQNCPSWTTWLEWTTCTATCGTGVKTRNRDCIGGNCDGSNTETVECGDTVCPTWDRWPSWSECSQTCGSGTMTKTRTCLHGDNCIGIKTMTQGCFIEPCSEWSGWRAWALCSKSCGEGTTSRNRSCIKGFLPTVRSECDGSSLQNKICNVSPCPAWSSWEEWSTCTQSCGPATKSRIRNCFGGFCDGEPHETVSCENQHCPEWNTWFQWGECSASCGKGLQERRRVCRNLEVCFGNASEIKKCKIQECAIFSSWSQWSACTASCGGGTTGRQRDCLINNQPVDTGLCGGITTEINVCNSESCPHWMEWFAWSECSVTCGTGFRRRFRDCSGKICEGQVFEQGECSLRKCREWNSWEPWGECSVTCGVGVEKRKRSCVTGVDCHGPTFNVRTCTLNGCPSWSNWNAWGICSKSCNGGTRSRYRKCGIDLVQSNFDVCVGLHEEVSECNDLPCPSWSAWSAWSSCSVSCGNGTLARRRTCNGGFCSGNGLDFRPCFSDCTTWTQWLSWTQCSVTCGQGTRTRRRLCNSISKSNCKGKAVQVSNCGDDKDCIRLTQWSEWSSCSATCGIGSKSRTQRCLGNNCPALISENVTCGEDPCPLWGPWSGWSTCSSKCGEGVKTRKRRCFLGRCTGPKTETTACVDESCQSLSVWTPWSPWALCSVTCGTGDRRRNRVCIGGNCDGNFFENEQCGRGKPCPSFKLGVGQWGAWTTCSVTCGFGSKHRTRLCDIDQGCSGAHVESSICDAGPCSLWGYWAPWSYCTVTCGSGQKIRRRECRIGILCEGSAIETDECFSGDCYPTWSTWDPWGDCAGLCGTGVRSRRRMCLGGSGQACGGKFVDFVTCTLPTC